MTQVAIRQSGGTNIISLSKVSQVSIDKVKPLIKVITD